jgi:hypothetical protein
VFENLIVRVVYVMSMEQKVLFFNAIEYEIAMKGTGG